MWITRIIGPRSLLEPYFDFGFPWWESEVITRRALWGMDMAGGGYAGSIGNESVLVAR